jgi:glycosyltransferase involved in cell wall biosynthesis
MGAATAPPTVTVTIPVFNRHDVVRRALASVRLQEFPDYEVIVVDDGSEPPLGADSGPGSGMRLLRHRRNRGAAAARNTAVAAARGRYVAFLDSDDEWLPAKLARQVAVMEGADATVAGCFTGFFYRRNRDCPGSVRRPLNASDWHRHFLAGCRYGPGSTLLVRRAVFAEVGPFDEELPRLEDWDWLLRASSRYRFAALEEPLAVVHRGGRPKTAAVRAAVAKIRARHLPGIDDSAGRRLLDSTLDLELAAASWWNREVPSALGQVLRASVKHPSNVLGHIRRRFGSR